MGFFTRRKQPLTQNLADQNAQLNNLRYNTAAAGTAIPLIAGTVRQQVNLIAYANLKVMQVPTGMGGGGKKGGGKGGGGKKGNRNRQTMTQFSADVDFGICQGPVSIDPTSTVWDGAGKKTFSASPWNFYAGSDGQAADPVFAAAGDTVGYSGTCHITQTPMILGATPAIPNSSFEIIGFSAGTGGPNYPKDANPGSWIADALTNLRYGAGFPAANLDEIRPGLGLNTYGDYCQAAQFAISFSLDGQAQANEWLSGLADLTNTAIVWSAARLKFVPYGDFALDANGATWTPNLIPEYSLTDDHFLPWSAHQDGGAPQEGQDDPVLIIRSNPADAINWLTIEYLDRNNSYNPTIIPVFDQGAIDQYGLRTGDNLHGHLFCNPTPSQISAQLRLQRLLYIRNTYRFKLGWQFGLLEPMDIVLLTERSAGMIEYPVRIIAIEEDADGALTVEAEQIETGIPAPPSIVTAPVPMFDSFSTVQARDSAAAGILVTTTQANEIVLLVAAGNNQTATPVIVNSVSGGGLTWTRLIARPFTDDSLGNNRAELWWALAPTALSRELVTVAWSGSVYASTAIAAGVIGVTDLTNPWDGAAGLPSTNKDESGALTQPTVSIATSHPRDLLITVAVASSVIPLNLPAPGWTRLMWEGLSRPGGFTQSGVYVRAVSFPQSAVVDVNDGANGNWITFGAALKI